jgi:hypothetical protein
MQIKKNIKIGIQLNLSMQIKKTTPRNGTQIEQNNTFFQVKCNSLTALRKHPSLTVPLPGTNKLSTYIQVYIILQ